MTSTPNITESFFQWVDERGFSRAEIAAKLGVDAHTLSTYRSRGLPRKKAVMAEAMVREQTAKSTSGAESVIPVSFTHDEFRDVSAAAFVVDTEVEEFIRRAAIHQARANLAPGKANGTNGP